MNWDELIDANALRNVDKRVGHDNQVGLLTRKGYQQAFELGHDLQLTYAPYLNVTASHVRSTRFSRTLLTVRTIADGMLGLAAPKDTEIRPMDQESLLVNEHFCPRIGLVLRHAQQSKAFVELASEMLALEKLAGDHFGLRVPQAHPVKGQYTPDGSGFFEISDLFFTQACHGLMKQADLGEQFCKLSRQAWQVMQTELAKNPLHSRLRVGHLVEEILQAQLEIALSADIKERRVFLVGAHDTTLAHLTTALELPVSAWPPYASSLVIETWKHKDAYEGDALVRFLYNGELLRPHWVEADADGLIPLGHLIAFSSHLLQTPYECSL